MESLWYLITLPGRSHALELLADTEGTQWYFAGALIHFALSSFQNILLIFSLL